jgi:hypothetical protein
MEVPNWSWNAYVASYMGAQDADVAADNMGPTVVTWMMRVGPDGTDVTYCQVG